MWVWEGMSDHDPLLGLGPEVCSYHIWMHFLRITLWISLILISIKLCCQSLVIVGMYHSFFNGFSKVSICGPSYINLNLFMLNEKKMLANIRNSWGRKARRSWESRGAPDRVITNVPIAMQTRRHQALFRGLGHMTGIGILWQVKIQGAVVSPVCYEIWHTKSLSILPHTSLSTSAEAYPRESFSKWPKANIEPWFFVFPVLFVLFLKRGSYGAHLASN